MCKHLPNNQAFNKGMATKVSETRFYMIAYRICLKTTIGPIVRPLAAAFTGPMFKGSGSSAPVACSCSRALRPVSDPEGASAPRTRASFEETQFDYFADASPKPFKKEIVPSWTDR